MAKIRFTGKSIQGSDPANYHVRLFPENMKHTSENYSCENPKVTVGNILIGEMYLEPQGTVEIINHDTGERCELEYKQRGWTSRNKDSIFAVIKDADGTPKYNVAGKYTESFSV